MAITINGSGAPPPADPRVSLLDFHRLPGDTPEIDTNLQQDELITAVELPALPLTKNSVYRKVRDRASYAFALVSVAAALEAEDGAVGDVRLALGGVAHKPWRATVAEETLRGAEATEENFRRAAEEELKDATGFGHNGVMVGALNEVAERGGARR